MEIIAALIAVISGLEPMTAIFGLTTLGFAYLYKQQRDDCECDTEKLREKIDELHKLHYAALTELSGDRIADLKDLTDKYNKSMGELVSALDKLGGRRGRKTEE